MNVLVKDFLRNKSLAQLKAEHGVNYRRLGNKISLNYDQIESRDNDPLAKQCRGLILAFDIDKLDMDNFEDVIIGETVILARPLDRFFNYGQDAAANIDFDNEKGIKYFEKLDGCFLNNTKLNCWDGSTIKIGDVVKKNLNPILIGMDKNGEIVPCKITNRFNNGTKKHWIKLTLDCFTSNKTGQGGQPNKLKVTPNHKFWSISKNDYVFANDIQVGDKLLHFVEQPDDKVLHLIKASLLGDGCIAKYKKSTSVKYMEGHCLAQKEYLLWKKEWLGECFALERNLISGYGSKMFSINSKNYKILQDLRKEWYPNNKKIIPNLDWVDDFAVAVWYMDDGSLVHNIGDNQKDRAVFSTNSFTKDGVEKLKNKLQEMYGVKCTIYFNKGWNLRINSGKNYEINNFWSKIAPHIHKSMVYKLPKGFRHLANIENHTGKEIFRAVPVSLLDKEYLELTKKNFPFGSCGFDIETTTNNYMINGVLAHNSCVIFYWDPYKSIWCSATRGVPEADLPIDGFAEYTFTSLFQKAIHDTTGTPYQDWLNNPRNTLSKSKTYIFELTSPYNRIVVKYDDCRVHLLGIRDTYTGTHFSIEHFAPIDIPVCPSYKLDTFADMLNHVSLVNPIEHEGIVACTKDFRRVKVKSPSYVAYNRIRDQVCNSPRSLIQIILDEKLDDFMQMIPANYLDKALVYQNKLREMFRTFDLQYKQTLETVNALGTLSDKVKQKQFALEITRSNYWLAPMMTIFSGKHKNLRDYFDSQKIHGGEYKVSFLNLLMEKLERMK